LRSSIDLVAGTRRVFVQVTAMCRFRRKCRGALEVRYDDPDQHWLVTLTTAKYELYISSPKGMFKPKLVMEIKFVVFW
jgi:hypothetical protein